jgi:ABC-type nitrate/sulfonate/bicarbonate transport system substrate-binding protein
MTAFRAGTFNVVNSGLPVAWVAHIYNGDTSQQGLWVRNEFLLPNGKIDPDKIDGLRVTLGPSSNIDAASMYYFYNWLKENGKTVDDVEFVNLGSASDMLVALESGSIDAAGLLTPFWVEAQDIAKPVAGVGFQSSAYLINTDWAADNMEAATAFFRAIARTIDENLTGDYKSDPELVAMIAEIMGVEPEIVAGSPSLVYDPELPLDVEVAEGLQDIWLEIGGIFDYTEPLDINRIVYRDPIENLYGTG